MKSSMHPIHQLEFILNLFGLEFFSFYHEIYKPFSEGAVRTQLSSSGCYQLKICTICNSLMKKSSAFRNVGQMYIPFSV